MIYRPETELLSHYFQAELSRQFDAWIWFTETKAVAARAEAHPPGPDDTYPSGSRGSALNLPIRLFRSPA